MNPLGENEIRIEPFESDPSTAYSQSYLDELLKRAAPAWAGVEDPDAWLEELRGGSET